MDDTATILLGMSAFVLAITAGFSFLMSRLHLKLSRLNQLVADMLRAPDQKAAHRLAEDFRQRWMS